MSEYVGEETALPCQKKDEQSVVMLLIMAETESRSTIYMRS